MFLRKTLMVELGLFTLLLTAQLYAVNVRIRNNFFAWGNPTVVNDEQTGQISADPHVYEKMKYYGYYSGYGSTNEAFVEIQKDSSAYQSINSEPGYWTQFTSTLSDYDTKITSSTFQEKWPPVSVDLSPVYKKILVTWNCDVIVAYVAEKLINWETSDTLEIAFETAARFIAHTDTVLRDRYNGCDSIIHQICEEINHHYRDYYQYSIDADTSYYYLKHENEDYTASYQFYFNIMDSVAARARASLPNKSKIAVDWMYHRIPNHFYPDNNNEFRNAVMSS